MPFILPLVGKSDVGKTTTILKLLPELKKRGYKVAVVKDCPHGFDLDVRGKDSWKFTQAGAQGIFLNSPDGYAAIKKIEIEAKGFPPLDLDTIDFIFHDFDLVLIEATSLNLPIKRIEILRRGINELLTTPSSQLLAVLTDLDLDCGKKKLFVNDIKEIVKFIEELIRKGEKE